MSVTTGELTEEIGDVTMLILENLLGLEASPAPGLPTDHAFSSNVHIVGEFNGAVSLSMSAELAHLCASRMFEMDPSELDPSEVDDAVGEVANMVGGNIKSLLAGPSALSLPTVINDGSEPSFPGQTATDHMDFLVGGEPLAVTLYEGAAPES